MLVARDQAGQLVSLTNRPDQQTIQKIRSSSQFCPSCRQPVILKAGAVKIPHFAHKQLEGCQPFSEGESERHLKGKADLHSWISRTHQVEAEAYLPEISQRPDLLVDRKVAIEYQCSFLSAALFTARTQGYQENEFFPFWIYGGPPIKRQGRFYQFSTFHRLFFQYSPLFGFWFLAYCPNREQFTLYSQLIPLTSSLYSASLQTIPLTSLSYPPHFAQPPASVLFSLSDWFKQKERWLQQKLYFQQGLYDPFFSAVYKTGHHPSLLPLCIGVPVRFMALIKNHPIEWQFYLWNDLLIHEEKVEEREAAAAIENRIKKGELQLNVFPVLSTPTITDLMKEYLAFWELAGKAEKEAGQTTFGQMEREKGFIKEFEELLMHRLIF
ncbi:competence protein CoiA [Pseudobacillus wudalianchiensis]|uniref:Competence protein CoiA n=1 Tax=Pseudobacillus wudalianchiensis TaxID=1743143 RepID=A0A1B9AU02_9BACI|nr:competence protein CoiA family protein [Bacillus wudalianchiensis]OCA87357.1 hypothetical protein A8F95_08945 [Bacillus wudalianchiensis]